MNVTAVVLAAGSGRRVGSDIPKQFLPLGGRPMLHHSVEVFEGCEQVANMVVALPAGDDTDLSRYPKITSLVAGGATRQGSLHSALAGLPDSADTVLVHDAARPLLGRPLIDTLLAALDDSCDGVIPAIPMEDTIKKVSGDLLVEEEVDRNGIWRVQTPQLFRRSVLEDALARAMASGLESTDCSQMLTTAGYRVRVVEGDPLNFKVTRAADLWLAEQILAARTEET
ncbi:MAG TPA: 2-C-methyl-D-erythritol 4-phosphate cytidylyltransferase [Actinomycetota bacterium]|nr:2-C-methyl-D-erythritol 4-phosphate cytidylyltransferase [Actinomycetota bacterium]